MDLKERIESFSRLGEILKGIIAGENNQYTDRLCELINNQHLKNEWFTPDNIRSAIYAIASELTNEKLNKWTDRYPYLKVKKAPVKAGVIMAGNIPLAGFHDFLSVLITGNNLLAKTSSKDSEILVAIGEILCDINNQFRDMIEFTEGTLADFDLVIATGSNNSARYFEYYFGKYPNIIRKNRNSIAIIRGDETPSELEILGQDIFSYFGLGCRNVSKIYVPEDYEISLMTDRWERFADIISHTKYANNYDFNKAVYIVNKEKFHDTGYLLLKEDARLSSPVSVIYYEYYKTTDDVTRQVKELNEAIQCIVGKGHIPFGKAQYPELWDYADGIDTIEFLQKKK